jgi:glycosyltransferase involved in cell wall biosynthesis
MTILHVVRSFDLSGRSRMVFDLSRGLRRHGFASRCVVLGREPGWAPAGLDVVALGHGEGFSPLAVLRLWLLTCRCRPALLHSHGRGAALHAAAAARAAGVPLVHTVHRADGDPVSGSAFWRRAILHQAGAVTAVSDAAADAFAARNAYPRDRVVTVYNGVDLRAFEGREPRPEGGIPVLVAVANLSGDKDIETLLRGFARVIAVRPAHLRIAGDGPRRRDAEGLVAALGLAGCVELLGFRTDVPDILRGADLFVHCARTEGLGISAIEAMAAGVPVVASATGGLVEIVQSGVNGRLFPAGDADAFRDAVLAALEDRRGAARMADEALARVTRAFSLEAMSAAYAAVYAGVLR